jgi:hypothetical protein
MRPGGVLRRWLPGAARVGVAVGGSAVLVWAATSRAEVVDVAAAAGPALTSVSGASLVRAQSLVCPGAELSGIDGVPDVPVTGTIAVASAPAALLPDRPRGRGEGVIRAGADVIGQLPVVRPARASAPLPSTGVTRLDARGSTAPAIAATQEWAADRTELRGLVTTACGVASTDHWLLAGGGGPGRQERLVLVNPGGNPVTAEVTVHGVAGAVGAARTQTVAPGARVSLLLDAWSGAQARPAVHVVSTGAGVHATLTDTWVEGSTARGADTVPSSAPPATRQVLPGVVVSPRTAVRVVVPGAEGAVVRVTFFGPRGLIPVTGRTVVSVAGGAVADLPLGGIPPGTYALAITADVPVVAGALTAVGAGGGDDELAWASSAPVITDLAGVALPRTRQVRRVVRLVSTSGASVADVVTVVDGRATTRPVNLLDGRTTEIALDRADAVWIRHRDGAGELRATLLSAVGGGPSALVSTLPVAPAVVSSPVSRAYPLP